MDDCCIHQKKLNEVEDKLRTCKKCGVIDYDGGSFSANNSFYFNECVWLCEQHGNQLALVIEKFIEGKIMEPMQADRTEQEKLIELSEKLSTHNTTHGKNVVFWSCKKCHPDNKSKKYFVPEYGPIDCNKCFRPPCNMCN